jgi:hypothetical protein
MSLKSNNKMGTYGMKYIILAYPVCPLKVIIKWGLTG